MSQAKSKSIDPQAAQTLTRRLREGAFIVLSAIAIFLFLSLVTYSHTDPGWSYMGSKGPIENAGGPAGAVFADIFLHLFGYLAMFFPLMVAYLAVQLFKGRKTELALPRSFWIARGVGFLLLTIGGAGLASIHFIDPPAQPSYQSGGILGEVISAALVGAFGGLGATLLLLAMFLSGVTLFTGISWLSLMDKTGAMVLGFIGRTQEWWDRRRDRRAEQRQTKIVRQERTKAVEAEKKRKEERAKVRIEPVVQKIEPGERAQKERQAKLFDDPVTGELPAVSILDEPKLTGPTISEESLQALSRLVELKLADFNIEAEVVAVHPGPVITRFELDLAAGVKVAKITNLAKDLARALSAVSVRIVEVIPGKSVIGLEVPNEQRDIVRLREVVGSREFEQSKSPLSMCLGKDISGNPVVIDLVKMPHLLVAGTTGSGKSVGINAMLVSILYKATPEDVRLILIDPKMLELSVYEGIPHLLTPVVTDMKDAANSLRWAVAEMERRYKLMSTLGVRNLAGYNRKVRDAIKAGEPLTDPLWEPTDGLEEQAPTLNTLPVIVVVIDELADMMMIVGKKVEELIARIAQKARAAGIHLLLATQRPSVDVITGLIKANIPSRIAFQVSSRIDSRTILDQMGAEQLLGQGDMLYLPGGTSIPTRVHGAFVADDEVHRVVDDWKKRGEPQYEEGITSGAADVDMPGMPAAEGAEDSESDPLYDEAVRIVTESRRASISGIQRRLKIGYNRAARMIEEMEAAGIVTPMQSNGNREVIAPPPPEL